jgi:hypothetical protein
MRKGERRWPADHQSLADQPCLASTQSLLLSSTSSCSYHAHSTDRKHQKESQFLSSFLKVLFIYFFESFRFYNMHHAGSMSKTVSIPEI